MKAAAIAWMAGRVCAVGGSRQARCLREKRARKRRARGTDSEVNALRSASIVVSSVKIESHWSLVADGAIIAEFNDV